MTPYILKCNRLYLALISLMVAILLSGAGKETVKPSDFKPPASGRTVSINFNNVDIRVFIEFISTLSKKNFIIDKRVKGPITIISPRDLTPDEAYRVFESVLNIHGFAAVQAGEVTKIIPLPEASAQNLNTRMAKKKEASRDQIVTRIIPLEYADSQELKTLLTPMLPAKSIILSYPDTNVLIITSTLSSITRLLKIIQTIDVQSTGKKISVIPVKYADAKKLSQELNQIFIARLKNQKASDVNDLSVKLAADERTNAIIILAGKAQVKKVEALIKILDRKVPKGGEKIRVYYLEHASAEHLVTVLQSLPKKEGKDAATNEAPSLPLLSQDIKITADASTNSLIVMAEKEDYIVLEKVIADLDIPRAMVYIECLIMEVNVTRGLNIGTEWKAAAGFNGSSNVVFGGYGGTGDSGYTNLSAVNSSSTLPEGFSVGVLSKSISIGGITFPSIQAVIQAFQNDKDVHILATPQLLTTENDEATITVGKNIPFQTKSAADSGSETYSSYEYKDVGITLKITPQISKGRLVRLNVYQELTKLDSVNQSTPDRPTTLKRHIETSIIVEDAGTVVIGGLIDESLTKTETKIPCLGNIPILGYGFKTINEGSDRTNLYVFLTPRVIQNPMEASRIYQKKKQQIESEKMRNEKFIRPVLIEP